MSTIRRPGTMSETERDTYRAKTPPKGVAAPIFESDDEVTGNYHGEQLLAARRARAEANPAHRIALIESEQKEQAQRLTRIEIATVEIRGDGKATAATLTGIERQLGRLIERDDREHAATVDDELDAKKARRKFWFTIAGAVFTGGAIGKFLHMLGLL